MRPTEEGMEEFLRIKLDGGSEPEAMDDGPKAEIMEIIPKKISEMYVWMLSFPYWIEMMLLTNDCS